MKDKELTPEEAQKLYAEEWPALTARKKKAIEVGDKIAEKQARRALNWLSEKYSARFELRDQVEQYVEVGIKRCPCGEYPNSLFINQATPSDTYNGSKYSYVSGNCCGEWEVEFRSNYLEGAALYSVAKDAWNKIKRWDDE